MSIPAAVRGEDVGKIEIWFADEARIGQKNKITRRWANRGTHPSAPRGSAHRLDLHLRSHLPEAGKGSRLDTALLSIPKR